MIEMTLKQAASLLNLTTDVDARFSGICIDTRTIKPGNLFIAITGERVDGHDYLDDAKTKGAVAALVTQKKPSSLPQLVVPDIVSALGQLGAAWRKQFTLPIIAVTGSNGKTTLKNLIASILTAACQGDTEQVLATQGNFNNHLGLPLTLARLNKKHRYAVIEMGMNHFGEIEYLTQLTQPTVAAITNAAAAHLAGVGSLAGVAKAKGEIFLGLTQQGAAILNRDDAFFDYWRQLIGNHPMLSFGFSQEADVRAIIHTPGTIQRISIQTPQGDIDVALPLLGKHNICNALAATAACLAAKIDLTAIKAGLEQIKPEKGRMQIYPLANGINIIDDTYNANPFSLKAAVDTLASFAGKRVLVLGDMKELGSEEANLHQSAGQHIRAAGIDFLFTYGNLTLNTSQAFGEGAYHFNDQQKLLSALTPMLQTQTTILVKGSRSMKMETVVKHLVELNG